MLGARYTSVNFGAETGLGGGVCDEEARTRVTSRHVLEQLCSYFHCKLDQRYPKSCSLEILTAIKSVSFGAETDLGGGVRDEEARTGYEARSSNLLAGYSSVDILICQVWGGNGPGRRGVPRRTADTCHFLSRPRAIV